MKTKEEIIADRDKAILEARHILTLPYFILDTETTGLNNAQMCQIAIKYHDGTEYKSLVKPTIPIESGAINVHHITDTDVEDAPDAIQVSKKLPLFGYMVIYNAPFDLGVLQQSLLERGVIYTKEYNSGIYDAMQIYSEFRGEWDVDHNNYRWIKLGTACEQCGIKIEDDGKFHDAMYDAKATDLLIKYIASQKLSTE